MVAVVGNGAASRQGKELPQMSELKPFDEFMDALVHCDTVKVILTGCGESTFETKPIYEGICALANRRAQPANEPPVRCGECANYQTQNCAAKHEQALMDFCSHGIRKPGGETDDDSYKYKACGRVI